MLNFRLFYQFANFTLLRGKYAVPPKPEQLSLLGYVKKYEKLTLYAYYQKLDNDKRLEIQQKFNQYQQKVTQWNEQYKLSKIPIRHTSFASWYCEENKVPFKIAEGKKIFEQIPQKDLDRYEKKFQSIVEEINKKKQQFEEEFAFPSVFKVSPYQFYVIKYGLQNQSKSWKDVTQQELEEFNKLAEEKNKQNHLKIQRIADKCNLSVEEFIKEVKEQKKQSKVKVESESSSESSDQEDAKQKDQKEQKDKKVEKVKQEKQEVKVSQDKQETKENKKTKETKQTKETNETKESKEPAQENEEKKVKKEKKQKQQQN
ncbi:hypothetical protein pb186bvf_003498 [Paramecium bursaria]